MKKNRLFIPIAILFMELCIGAKAQRLEYFTLASPDNSNVLFNKPVSLCISMIHANSKAGTILYNESFTLTRDQRGMLDFTFGKGKVLSGNLSAVNWNSKNVVKIEIDPITGINYQRVGFAVLDDNIPLVVPNL